MRCFGRPSGEADVHSYPVPAELVGANPALDDAGRRPADRAGRGRRGHRAFAHLVRERGRPTGGDVARHPARRHRAQPRAAAPVEGGAARRRLPRLQLDRTGRDYQRADAVIAVSDGMRRDILRSYPAIDEQRVHVVHNGIDLERWRRDRRPALLRALGIDPDRPSVVFVGRITRQKGLPLPAARRGAAARRRCSSCCAPARRTPRRSSPRCATPVEALQQTAHGVVWLDTLLAPRGAAAVLSARDDVRLPVHLRAARHREPRGDGLRRAGGRHGDRRHSRGRRRRRHRAPGADRAGAMTAPARRSTPTSS